MYVHGTQEHGQLSSEDSWKEGFNGTFHPKCFKILFHVNI